MSEEAIECGSESLRPIEGIWIGTSASGTGYEGRDDILLASFAPGTAAAGVLTTSRTAAAPVRWNRTRLQSGAVARGLVVNAGNANCFNGDAGDAAVTQTTDQAAALLGCSPEEILVGSTGKIGVPLDMTKLQTGVAAAHEVLSSDGWQGAAAAIMTTDRFPKAAATSAVLAGKPCRVQGITKGSTMIAPSMATTLSFLFTDAPLSAAALQQALREATAATYNGLSVDNTQSTNDMILLFSTGSSSNSAVIDATDSAEYSMFQKALQDVLANLMGQIIEDARKDGTVIRVAVAGAESFASAQRIGRRVADSYLIRRMAAQGGDFAIGRLVAAVGMAEEPVEQSKLVLRVGGQPFTRNGGFIDGITSIPVSDVVNDRVLAIDVDVGVGDAEAVSYAVVHKNFV